MYPLKPITRPFTVDAFYNAFDVVRPRGFYFAGEMHDFWEAVFVVDGQITVSADEQVLSLCAGQLLFHKPLEFHRLWTDQNTASHLQLLSFHAVGEGMRFFEGRCLELSPAEQQQYGHICSSVATTVALYTPGKPSKAYTESAFSAVLALESFLQALTVHSPASSHELSAGEQRFREILHILHAHCEESLSVEELADLCGCSVSNLKRIFARYADRSVAKYFLTVKMQRAMQLLDAATPPAEVAKRLHFSDVGYFYTVFRREIGMTPGAYLKSRKRTPRHLESH